MEVVLHKGVFKRTKSLSQAVFVITGMTIGAGVFGLPYAIAQVGLVPGLILIACIGLLVLGVNIVVGEIALETGEDLQLAGLAGVHLGSWAKYLLSVTTVVGWFGTLLAYIIGEGVALSALLGGNAFLWSIIFWSLANFLLWGGLSRVKRVTQLVSALVIGFIVIVSLALFPEAHWFNAAIINPSKIFLPIGIIMFALHATPAIAEVHSLIKKPGDFRRAIMWGTGVPVVVYMLFTAAVVLTTGVATTQVATVGLGEVFGPSVTVVANAVAILAMLSCYLGLGTALHETFSWDYKVHDRLAMLVVMIIPLLLFIVGLRNFTLILDVVGGVFVTIEIALLLIVYLFMRHKKYQRPVQRIKNSRGREFRSR